MQSLTGKKWVTGKEWAERYAQRMINQAAVDRPFAMAAARIAWNEMTENETEYDEPENAADSEMSHWDDDGEDGELK